MHYSRVHIEAIGYELAPVVVSSADLEARLEPLYKSLHLPMGQLEYLTGIYERRWWNEDYSVAHGAAIAARKALAASNIQASEIEMLVYAGVCREQLEPATACHVAAELGISGDATIYDLSNACLGVLNGIIEVANRIELGQCKAGLVVSCETAREINEVMIDQMVRTRSMDVFKQAIATLTGGSGAVAVLVVDAEYSSKRRKLLGATSKNAPQHNALCRWGFQSVKQSAATAIQQVVLPRIERGVEMGTTALEKVLSTDAGHLIRSGYDYGMKHLFTPFMSTDAGAVLKHGVDLGLRTWKSFLTRIDWPDVPDKIICHQVGSGHEKHILETLNFSREKTFNTYPFLGNIGTVSLPLTAAIAEERGFFNEGDRVGFLGIGSGLNCMMLGIQW